MSGISGTRADPNRAAQDTGGRNWEELSSNNERFVPLPAPGSPPAGSGPDSDTAAQWQPRRGRCDIRQVVSAA
jgi:hypothetical protein